MAMMPEAPTDDAASPAAGDMPAAPEDEGAEEGDLSKGYTIEISCLPDGTYQVSPPESLQAEAEEEQGEPGEPGSEAGETYSSIGDALKAVLQAIKANPMGQSDQASFDAGYNA